MEVKVSVDIIVPDDFPDDLEAAAKQMLLLLAARIIEAVTRDGNSSPNSRNTSER